jgi:LPXTG-motif cell wall-anchored protein
MTQYNFQGDDATTLMYLIIGLVIVLTILAASMIRKRKGTEDGL